MVDYFIMSFVVTPNYSSNRCFRDLRFSQDPLTSGSDNPDEEPNGTQIRSACVPTKILSKIVQNLVRLQQLLPDPALL